MVQRITACAVGLALVMLTAAMAGCGDDKTREAEEKANRMTLPGTGVFVTLPAGWSLDGSRAYRSGKGNCAASFEYDFHRKRDIVEYARSQERRYSGRIVAEMPRTVEKCEVLEVVVEYPARSVRAVKVYIRKQGLFIRIVFECPANEYRVYESDIWTAVESLVIE